MEFTEIHLLLVVPAALGLITRYNSNRNMWIALSAVSVIVTVVISFYTPLPETIFLVAGSAFLGSTSPEMVNGARNAIQQFLSNPKIVTGIILVLVIIYLLENPELLNNLIVLILTLGGIWIILRPLIKGKG